MHETNLRTIDLNLLVALDALLQHRSVTRAGVALGLSQPAMSRALSRLRHLFEDELLVKTGRAMAPTRLGLELKKPVRRVLDDVRRLVQPRSFEPATAHGTVHINAPDATTIVVLSKALNHISHRAPGLDFVITNVAVGRYESMADGEIDLAVDAFAEVPQGFYRQRLIDDRLVCMSRADHPVVAGGLDIEAYTFWPHANLATATSTMLERLLAKRGLRRRNALTVPNFITAASVVAETDWLLTLPSILARRIQTMFPLAIIELPFEVPGQGLDQIWHQRSHRDPGHMWLRQRISALVQERF